MIRGPGMDYPATGARWRHGVPVAINRPLTVSDELSQTAQVRAWVRVLLRLVVPLELSDFESVNTGKGPLGSNYTTGYPGISSPERRSSPVQFHPALHHRLENALAHYPLCPLARNSSQSRRIGVFSLAVSSAATSLPIRRNGVEKKLAVGFPHRHPRRTLKQAGVASASRVYLPAGCGHQLHLRRRGLRPQAFRLQHKRSAARRAASISGFKQRRVGPPASLMSAFQLVQPWGHSRRREAPSRWPLGPLDSSARAADVSADSLPASWADWIAALSPRQGVSGSRAVGQMHNAGRWRRLRRCTCVPARQRCNGSSK